MADYVDAAVQTMIAGLTKHPSPFPPVLSSQDTTTTPPDDMPAKELYDPQETSKMSQTISNATVSPTLLLRRKNRPLLVARISLPACEVEPEGKAEGPKSPPPTQALMSPLPAANTLHAGHTPIFPRSLSPLRAKEDSDPPTPEEEEDVLTGPLTLPAQPGDGTEDRIELKVLDAELEKIARERVLKGGPEPTELASSHTAENGGQDSRKGSGEGARRRSSADEVLEVVDGVLLKKPRMNLGAPLGQI